MNFKIILPVLLLLMVCLAMPTRAENEDCADVKVLMYHHIRDAKEAQEKNQTGLNVTPDYFEQHMKYLREEGYAVIGMDQLISFLDDGIKLPDKSAMITVDDGYEDNYLDMFPILKKYGFRAIIFTPTGLVEKPDYLTWKQIEEMNNSGLITFANHTWSHHGSQGTKEKQLEEIGTANKELEEKELNVQKTFAYPYGRASDNAKEVLRELGYKLAFTTTRGTMMCRESRFDLPRIRAGNASLASYGL